MPDLPTEILREIFAYLSSPLHVHRAHKFPWYLGKVCARWRTLFFSMQSTFWRKLDIEWLYDHRPTPSPERVKTILTFFLNRTQGAPFSFSLFRIYGYSKQEKKHVRWIMKDLLDYSRQCEDVSFRLQLEDLNLLRYAKGHLPLLKRLEIVVDCHYRSMGLHPSVTGIFEDAPLLTHVAVEDISRWEFNWSSLTTLRIGRCKISTSPLLFFRSLLIWWSSLSTCFFTWICQGLVD